ncbi:MAG: TonB-dependent receptor [Acidobacteria bacterium]|nr:TonB-dependent receptor [Acidobacteriota bacterium]
MTVIHKSFFHVRLAVLSLALLVAASGHAAGPLNGRVSDLNGAPVSGAQVTVKAAESATAKSATTAADGKFTMETLPAGVYTITIRRQGFADMVRQYVASDSEPARELSFRLQSTRPQAISLGADELNPNVFVVKLDANEAQRQLGSRGANAALPTDFRSVENSYGSHFGFQMRSLDVTRPRNLLGEYHGSLYETHQNSRLNARSFFQAGGLLPSRRNEFGATIGGPIVKSKLSFDFAWSKAEETGYVNGNIQVPLPEERTPLTTDPASRAMISRLFSAYPNQLPNRPDINSRQLNTNGLRDISSTAYTGRFDLRPTGKDQIVFEQRYYDATEKPFELIVGQNPITLLRPQSAHLTEIHTVSPNTTARLVLNFDRLRVSLAPTESYRNLLAPLGITNVPDIAFGRNGDFSNIGPGSSYPRLRVENRFHVAPEATQVRGRHTITAGVLVSRLQINDLQSDNSRGSFEFSRNAGRSAVENFRLGLPTTFKINLGDFYRGFRNWEHAVYLQDRIKLLPTFTLTLGMRHEVVTKPVEVNDRTDVGFGTDANNFGPTAGFAWNPRGGKVALRGGYGWWYSSIYPLLYQRARFNPPDVKVISIDDSPNLVNPLASVAGVDTANLRSGLNLLSPDLVAPYMHVYSFSIERELPGGLFFRTGYAGSRTVKMPWEVISNRGVNVPGVVATTRNVDERRPDSRYLAISTVTNGGISYYDSLQVAFDRRTGRSITWTARYVFSKAINTGDTNFADIGTGRHISMEPFNIVGDLKAVENFDTPHAFSLTFRHQLPTALLGSGLVNKIVGGWRSSGTLTLRSGTPYMLHTGSDAPGFGNVDGIGQERPNILKPAIIGKSVDHPDTSTTILRKEYFDTNLPVGGRGNLGFNSFRTDGTTNMNFAVEREFALRRGGDQFPSLQFRAEFFNFFNHAQFDSYAPHVANEIFGKITNTVNRGRVTQLFMRLRF